MSPSVLETIRTTVKGEVTGPDDAGYDDARAVYNAMIDRRPAAVVQASSADDVAAAVNVAAGRTGSISPSAAAATASPVSAPATTAW